MKKINLVKNIKSSLKNKKISLITYLLFALFILIGLYIGVTVARYAYLGIKNGVFNSKSFYFNCDKMGTTKSIYQLNNWSGADVYTIVFNMNSFKNNKVGANSDIVYTISYTCSNNIICSSSKNSGTIYSSTNTDSFTVSMTPNVAFTDGDEAYLDISATSTNPFVKTLSGRFTLKVGKAGLSYEIQDVASRQYLELRITNTLDYYTVKTAFTSSNNIAYAVGDRLDVVTYGNLTSLEKENCASAIINLSFDPSVVILDMTSNAYLKGYNFTNTTISNLSYLNGISFKMDALSSELVNFYKANIANNYTYPFVNQTSVVNVTYDMG